MKKTLSTLLNAPTYTLTSLVTPKLKVAEMLHAHSL